MSNFSCTKALQEHPLFRICAHSALEVHRKLGPDIGRQLPPDDLLCYNISWCHDWMTKQNLAITDANVTQYLGLLKKISYRRSMSMVKELLRYKRKANWMTVPTVIVTEDGELNIFDTISDDTPAADDAARMTDQCDTIRGYVESFVKYKTRSKEKQERFAKFLNMYLDQSSPNYLFQSGCAEAAGFSRERARQIVEYFYRYVRQKEKAPAWSRAD